MDAPSTPSEACSLTASDLPTDPVFALHRGGKIEMRSTARVRDAEGLALAYTPGVARVCDHCLRCLICSSIVLDSGTMRAEV